MARWFFPHVVSGAERVRTIRFVEPLLSGMLLLQWRVWQERIFWLAITSYGRAFSPT